MGLFDDVMNDKKDNKDIDLDDIDADIVVAGMTDDDDEFA